MSSSWLQFVKKVQKENPGLSYHQAMIQAAPLWKSHKDSGEAHECPSGCPGPHIQVNKKSTAPKVSKEAQDEPIKEPAKPKRKRMTKKEREEKEYQAMKLRKELLEKELALREMRG